MLRCLGFIAAAIGLTFSSALGQSDNQDQQPQRATEEQQEPANISVDPIRVEIVESEASSETRESQEREARQREIEDLAAQQGMNDATQAMNDATQRMAEYAFWSTVIVGIGTVLFIWSLFLTRQAVVVTRKIGEAQTRAYVGVSIVDNNSFVLSGLEAGHYPSVAFILKNSGNSPAKMFSYIAACGVMTDDFFDNKRDSVISADDRRPSDTLPQGDVSHCIAEMQRVVTADDLAAVFDENSGTSFFLFGIASYEDVFGNDRKTRFCYRLVPMSFEHEYGGAHVNCDWERTHHHNDAD